MELTDYQKKCIKEWVENPDSETCPFGNDNFNAGHEDDGEICRIIFPKIGMIPKTANIFKICMTLCPCTVYGKDYVRRQAQKFIGEN